MIRRGLALSVLFSGAMVLVAGCGGGDEPEVVSGVTPEFIEEIDDSREGYGESMQQARQEQTRPGN